MWWESQQDLALLAMKNNNITIGFYTYLKKSNGMGHLTINKYKYP